jgi:hypothetical protein
MIGLPVFFGMLAAPGFILLWLNGRSATRAFVSQCLHRHGFSSR